MEEIDSSLHITGIFPVSSGIGLQNHVADILSNSTFHEVKKGNTVRITYIKGSPLIIRLGGIDNSNNSMTELMLISSEDYQSCYGATLVTPYFLINMAALPLTEQSQGYKGVRVSETISLGHDSDPRVASRIGLDKNKYISRFHMELRLLESGEFLLCDLGSSNGTFINYTGNSVTDQESVSKRNNIQRNMEEIEKDSFLLKLWPDLAIGMRQGPVGNCYFVAALNAIKEHSQGAKLLRSMIQPDPRGYRVKFRGIDKFTLITDIDIHEMGLSMLHGSLGDNILERAYWRLRRERYDPTLLGGFSQEIIGSGGTALVTDDRGRKVHEGGQMRDVLSDFFGDIVETRDEYIGRIHNIFPAGGRKIFESLDGEELLTASTPDVGWMNYMIGDDVEKRRVVFSLYFPSDSKIYQEAYTKEKNKNPNSKYNMINDRVYEKISQDIASGKIQGDRPIFLINDINGVRQRFNFNHAYSIGYIDLRSGYVEVINPHDTVNKRYYIGIEQFYQYFLALSITKIKNSLDAI